MLVPVCVQEKKDIIWKGLPSTGAEELKRLQIERDARERSLRVKDRKRRDLELEVRKPHAPVGTCAVQSANVARVKTQCVMVAAGG